MIPMKATLSWPNHAELKESGWQLWKQKKKQMFPFDHNKNYNPPWPGQDNYKTNYQWSWCICPTMFNLFHNTQTGW